MKKINIFNKKYTELTGCIHNHTQYSFDSKAKLKTIVKAAEKNGLDYITINDHRTCAVLDDQVINNNKDMMIIIGCEINDPDNNNHLLVFNSDKIIIGESAKTYIDYYSGTEAVTFIAHPLENRASKRFRKYIWTDLKVDSFDGIEIWNYLSEWIGKLNPLLNGIWLILFPTLFVKKPLSKVMKYWDDLNKAGKRRSAIGSVDAHAGSVKKCGIKLSFLSHNALFKSIRTNVLIPEPSLISQKNILTALKNGNSYIVNYKIGEPYNFYAGIASEDGGNATFGQEIKYTKGMKYYFRLPKIARVKLFKDGKKIASKLDEKGEFIIEQNGNYRLEIYRFGFGWIFTNNIYVTKEGSYEQ
ncbi:MAG: PHP domain-containing protein [Candidatus Cloacimonetes bacterium]|nr:PHP domain-containing protein [Candidatus Cloacimonadota bacterium]